MPLKSRTFVVGFAVALVTWNSSASFAQNIWQGDDATDPLSWHVAENWSALAVPNGATNVVVGLPAPAVIDTASAAVHTLLVQAGGEIEIEGVRTLSLIGDTLTNDGLITVNSNGSTDLTTLSFGSVAVTLDGSGEIVLAANPNGASLINFNPNNPTTQQASHTISGEGQVALNLINFGTITAAEASGDSTAEMLITGGSKTNHGTMQSSPTANLRLGVSVTQSSTGEIVADTGTVFVNNIVIAGGTLRTTGGGVFRTSGNALTFDGVDALDGQFNLVSTSTLTGNLLVEGGGFSNQETILINQDSVGSSGLRFVESGQIDGVGEIIMNAPELGAMIVTNGGAVGTFGPNQIVRGVGQIQGEIINNGAIVAEPRSSGSVLQLSVSPKTNNQLIRANPGATLDIAFGTTISQDDFHGRISADGGTVQLRGGSTIIDGRLQATDGGQVRVTGNARLEGVTSNAAIEVVPGSHALTLASTITNTESITVGSSLRASGDVLINGLGEIVLNAPELGVASIDVPNGSTLTLGSGQTLRRTAAGGALAARVNGAGTFVNDGHIAGASELERLNLNGPLAGSGSMEHVNIRSVHRPGGSGETAQVMLEGVYDLTNFGAQLEMEIGGLTPGAGYDQLLSTDPNNLITIGNGNTQLNVSLIDSFFPANGDIFTLVDTAGTLTGMFTQVNLPALPSGFAWLDVSDESTIAYQLIAPLAADFDEDGNVDADDLVRWQDGYSNGTTHMQGDANDDQDVDGSDFLIWQRQLGNSRPPRGTASAVPESTSLALGLIAASIIGCIRRS